MSRYGFDWTNPLDEINGEYEVWFGDDPAFGYYIDIFNKEDGDIPALSVSTFVPVGMSTAKRTEFDGNACAEMLKLLDIPENMTFHLENMRKNVRCEYGSYGYLPDSPTKEPEIKKRDDPIWRLFSLVE